MKKVIVMFVTLLMALSALAINTRSIDASERERVINVVERENDAPVRRLDFYPTMSYQGLLKDNDGKSIEDGKYNITFKIYGTEEAKEAIWKEVQEVEITNGIINCFIGAEKKLDLPFDKQYWLSVGVNNEELPRMIMAGTPYSLHARRISEDAIVAGRNISISKDEDGKLVLSGSVSSKDGSGEIYNLEDDDYDGIKMLTCETDLWGTYYGDHSVALGYKAIACGDRSIALGDSSLAKASSSTAIGYHNYASTIGATALGYDTEATGWYSTSMGYCTKADGTAAMALGCNTEAKNNSFIYGYNARSDSSGAYTFGNNVINTFPTSFVIGINPGADSLYYQFFVNRSFVSIGYTESENRSIDSCSTIPRKSFLVNGSVYAKAYKVKTTAWADYVFNDDYNLKPLSEVEDHIRKNKHLPGMITEKEALEQGVDIGDIQVKLLEKIEELTLYIIEQDKKNIRQDKLISELESLLR